MTAFVESENFHYEMGKLDIICEDEEVSSLGLDEAPGYNFKNENVKSSSIKRKEKWITRDSIISGFSIENRDSGFNSEVFSSLADPPSSHGTSVKDNSCQNQIYSVKDHSFPSEFFSKDKNESLIDSHSSRAPIIFPGVECLLHSKYSRCHKNNEEETKERKQATIKQHYYPEEGWGYVIVVVTTLVTAMSHGLQLSFGVLLIFIHKKWGSNYIFQSHLLGSLCLSVSLLLSPLFIGLCKRRSPRLPSVIGGFLLSLGILFSSFTTQFHQLYISYGVLFGIGVGMTSEGAFVILGQYFKRRREVFEIALVSGSGLGVLFASLCLPNVFTSLGWRLCLTAISAFLPLTSLLGLFYRSASLYHPQRRAILHLKTQRRKIKKKEQFKSVLPPQTPQSSLLKEKPPFFEISSLKSRTLQIILLSSFTASWGLYGPLLLLSTTGNKDVLSETQSSILILCMGAFWIVGTFVFGALTLFPINFFSSFRLSRQYLTQISLLLLSLSLCPLTFLTETYETFILVSCLYGFALGAYHYSLRMYIYQKVRAKHFPRSWSFTQSAMGLPTLLGVPLMGHLHEVYGSQLSYGLSSLFTGSASCLLLLVNLHKRQKRVKSEEAKKEIEGFESPGLFSHKTLLTNEISVSKSFFLHNEKDKEYDEEKEEKDEEEEEFPNIETHDKFSSLYSPEDSLLSCPNPNSQQEENDE